MLFLFVVACSRMSDTFFEEVDLISEIFKKIFKSSTRAHDVPGGGSCLSSVQICFVKFISSEQADGCSGYFARTIFVAHDV